MLIDSDICPAWYPAWVERCDSPLQIICFPYAGGSANGLADWSVALKGRATVLPYELPGHGARFCEDCRTDRAALVDEIANDLVKFGNREQRLVLMGHSMGATIAYEVGLALGGTLPLLLSGRAAPGYAKPLPSDLSDVTLTRRMTALGGTPTEIMRCQEMLDVLLPIMRADYKLLTSRDEMAKRYDGPVLAMGGDHDDAVPTDALEAWVLYCRSLQIATFPGGHFFFQTQFEDVVSRISKWLESL